MNGSPAIRTVTLSIEGMHCGSCVSLIEESLGDLSGVASVSVDLDSARAVVGYDDSVVDLEAIQAAITEAGYSSAPSAPAG